MEDDRKDQIDLRDYLRVIMKRRWTVITVFTVIVLTVAINSFTAAPIYNATARIIIDKENPRVVSIQEVMSVNSSGTDYYQTQYKILESRTIARKTIRQLRLGESEEFFPKPKEDFISVMKRSVEETITRWIESITSLLKTEDDTPHETSEEDESDFDLVSTFIKRLKVNPIRNSRLVDVSYEAKDPVLATKIVNTLVGAYIEQNMETKLKAVQNAVKWLHNRIDGERKKVGKAEQALLRYKQKHSIVTDFSSDTERVTAQKLAELNEKVVEAESRRVEAETRYKQAMELRGTPDMLDSISEVLNNELIRDIKSMEVKLYNRMSELSKKYGQKHPQMIALESELKTLQKRKAQEVKRVVNSLRNEYRVAEASEKSLKAALGRQKRESLDLNKKAIDYSVLQREAQSARHMYELLVKRFKEASVTEDMRTGNIREVDRAEVPQKPVKPRKKLNILLAVIVGLVTGTGLAFFFEYLDNTIKVPEDVKQYLKIPYLGPVPAIAAVMDGNRDGAKNPEMVTFHSPKSTASEAYRGIRTGILFSSAETEPRVILVSSAGPKEGKTITTVNLAITMAQSGNRVVLLDCDMRRPKIHKLFDLSRERGMSNILVGGCTINEAVAHSQIPNLDVIPSGPIPPNPSEMLGSNRMTDLLDKLKGHYKRIIIDSPPITAVTDAVVLAKLLDGVVLVIRVGETPREVIQNGLGQLQSVNANILGAVLNSVDMGRDSYHYYQYYYYYYGEDGEGKKKSRKEKRSESQYQGA